MRRELSVILLEIEDKRLAGITVTRVEMTKDIRIAKVFYTVHDEVPHKKNVLEAIHAHMRTIRSEVASRVFLKFVPELIFREDEMVEHKRHMDELFDRIARERGENGGGDVSSGPEEKNV